MFSGDVALSCSNWRSVREGKVTFNLPFWSIVRVCCRRRICSPQGSFSTRSGRKICSMNVSIMRWQISIEWFDVISTNTVRLFTLNWNETIDFRLVGREKERDFRSFGVGQRRQRNALTIFVGEKDEFRLIFEQGEISTRTTNNETKVLLHSLTNALVEPGDMISFLQFSLLFGLSRQLVVELLCRDTLQRLSQRDERDLIRIRRIVNEIAFDRIAVGCDDRRQRALLTNAFVQLILPTKRPHDPGEKRRRRRNWAAAWRISWDVRHFPSRSGGKRRRENVDECSSWTGGWGVEERREDGWCRADPLRRSVSLWNRVDGRNEEFESDSLISARRSMVVEACRSFSPLSTGPREHFSSSVSPNTRRSPWSCPDRSISSADCLSVDSTWNGSREEEEEGERRRFPEDEKGRTFEFVQLRQVRWNFLQSVVFEEKNLQLQGETSEKSRRKVFELIRRSIEMDETFQLEGKIEEKIVRHVHRRQFPLDLFGERRQTFQSVVRQRQRGEMSQLSDASRQDFKSRRIAQLEQIQPLARRSTILFIFLWRILIGAIRRVGFRHSTSRCQLVNISPRSLRTCFRFVYQFKPTPFVTLDTQLDENQWKSERKTSVYRFVVFEGQEMDRTTQLQFAKRNKKWTSQGKREGEDVVHVGWIWAETICSSSFKLFNEKQMNRQSDGATSSARSGQVVSRSANTSMRKESSEEKLRLLRVAFDWMGNRSRWNDLSVKVRLQWIDSIETRQMFVDGTFHREWTNSPSSFLPSKNRRRLWTSIQCELLTFLLLLLLLLFAMWRESSSCCLLIWVPSSSSPPHSLTKWILSNDRWKRTVATIFSTNVFAEKKKANA